MTFSQRLHRLRFFVTDAMDEWRHSPGINLLAVATLATTLFMAGIVILVLSNLERRVEELRQNVRVEVYLDEQITEARRLELREELASLKGVANVEYVDKREAARRYREWAGETADLVEELESNPLPASFEVFLDAGPRAEERGGEVARLLDGRSGVEDVRFNRVLLQRLESLLRVAQAGGTGLAVIMFAAVVFVMASVLRLAVYARRNEIEIMLLVGATPAFVRGPFLVAGLCQGVIASFLALLLVELVRRSALAYSSIEQLVLIELVAARTLTVELSGLLLAIGLVVSLTGSYFAVRRPA